MDAYLKQERPPSAHSQAAALVATLPVPYRLRDAGVPEAVLDSVAAEEIQVMTASRSFFSC